MRWACEYLWSREIGAGFFAGRDRKGGCWRLPLLFVNGNLRSHKVIIDADLAELYGVITKRLNEQVRRNSKRFPSDFMFQLTKQEKGEVVAICDHLERLKFSPVLPLVFTEHGAIMAASVLNTARAFEMSVQVVRAYVKLREFLATHEVIKDIALLKRVVAIHGTDIEDIKRLLTRLIETPEKPKKQIGFSAGKKDDK